MSDDEDRITDDDRTTEIGLFNFAHSYWRSAVALHLAKVEATHWEDPVWFLYIHAVELYLKAFLCAHNLTPADLKRLGHRISDLASAAKDLGLTFDDEDDEVVALLSTIDLTTFRYIKTGAWTRPHLNALDRTCNSFHDSVAALMRAKGHTVREFPRPRP